MIVLHYLDERRQAIVVDRSHRDALMTTFFGTMSVRLAFGAALALGAAGFALGGVFGSMVWPTAGSAVGLAAMKFNAGLAILAGCAGWFLLLGEARWRRGAGLALLAMMAALAVITLLQHLFGLDFGIDALTAKDASPASSGHPGRSSVAVCVALLLAAAAIGLSGSSERVADLRQFTRLAGLAVPLFTLSLHVYDPTALAVLDGFESTSLDTTIALALLLGAVGFDRPAASLRWQIANIGVVVIAPLVALTVHFASAEREGAIAAAGARLAATARLGAERQEAVIAQTRQALTFLSRSPAVRSLGPACVAELAENMPLNPLLRSLYTVDRSGLIGCADQRSVIGLNIDDRDYVRQAFATGRVTVSGFILARKSGQPRIAIALPATSEAGAPFLLVASLDIEALSGPLDALDDGMAEGATATLVDRSGVVIARRPQRQDLVGESLADATFVTQALANPNQPFEASELNGRAAVFVARRVLDDQGTLIVGAPKREIVRPVDVRLNRRLWLIFAILGTSLALGVLCGEAFVLQPLRRLIGYAGRLEAGDFAARPEVRASGEVGALGRALAVSAAAIEDRERRLVETEALFRGLFDHSPDSKAVIRVEPSGGFTVETWNAAAVATTGLSAAEVVGRSPRHVFPGARGEAIEQDLRRTLELGRVQTIEREPNVNGQQIVFEMVQVPLRNADGAIERIFLSARDISERKRVERLKNEFVSTVSHELRTPLTSIAGSLGLLAGGAAGPLTDRARRLITIAHTNSLRLVRLINDILDIEKIEAGRMTFELKSLSVEELVSQAIGGLKSYADEFGVEIALATDERGLTVYGDEDRLTQVVTNLVSNAVKFSPRGETVTVSIRSDGEAVVIAVMDRGPGVPEAFHPRLFTKFAQADGSDQRRKGGTGLGLAIVREIVERHAGAVSYRACIGGGAEFEVRLARVAPRSQAAPIHAEPPRPTVLICEDDALIAAIMAEQIREAGFEVLTAGTVRSALQMVATREIGALLVDLSLPDGDGLSLIGSLRAMPRGRRLPVMVVSGSAEKGRSDPRAADLNVAAWVSKPFDAGRLEKLFGHRTGTHAKLARILHVADDADLCKVVSTALAPIAKVVATSSVDGTRRALDTGEFDLAILDLALEDGHGRDLLGLFAQASPRPVPVIVFSAHDADREVASKAEATLTKSRTPLADLVDVVTKTLAKRNAAVQATHVEDRRSFG